MAQAKYLSLIDNDLKSTFDRKPVDPIKTRRPLIRGIDRALDQFKSGSTGPANAWWKRKNDVVALTVQVGGDVFRINHVDTNHMPADRFEEFLGLMRSAVDAGEFDAELANHGKGDAEVHIPKKAASTISPEAAKARGIKAAASRRANKEARGAAKSR